MIWLALARAKLAKHTSSDEREYDQGLSWQLRLLLVLTCEININCLMIGQFPRIGYAGDRARKQDENLVWVEDNACGRRLEREDTPIDSPARKSVQIFQVTIEREKERTG
jgi:hypothetical protein